MRTLGGIRLWVSSFCRGRSGATCRDGLREGGVILNQPNSLVPLHVKAADGRGVSLLMRGGRLEFRSDLSNEDAVQMVMAKVDFALMPAPDAAIFRVTVGGRTSEVRRVDGHLVHCGDLPTSLPARIFLASIAGAIEAKFGALMCGAVALDGRRRQLQCAEAL